MGLNDRALSNATRGLPVRTRSLLALAGAIGASAVAAGAASAAPDHILLSHRFAQPPTTAQCETSIGIACYNPAQFEQAFDLNPLYHAGLNGAGRTIVI